MNPKATVGRVVYYKSYGTPGGEYPSVERAAIITEVGATRDGDTGEDVSLCVLNPEGMFFNREVKHGEGPGQWDWMPFQKRHVEKLS